MSLFKVRYKGLSDVREMSKRDLAAAGVGVDGPMRWDAGNRKVVFVRDPSDELLEVFKAEGTFTVTEVDEGDLSLEGETLVTGEALDDTGQTVVQGTQSSTKGESNADADPLGGSVAGTGSTGRGSRGRGSSTSGGGTAGNGSST